MSFGASAGDIIIVVSFCRELYRKCRSAGGEYDEISREVRGLHTVLKHLKYEVEAPESPLNKDQSKWGRQLAPIIGDCDFTLRQLDELLQKYGRLGAGGGTSPSSPSSARVLWERMKFGSNELDTLGSIRVKLLSHKTTLTLFLDTIQLHQSGKMTKKLDDHGGQLDSILDKVDNIAARMNGQREGSGSVMTSYEDDDKEVWKQFRRELVAEGFSSDVLQQHKDVLRAYICEIDQNGLLDVSRPPTPPMVAAKQWVDSVHSASSEDSSAMPRSLGPKADCATKEMLVRNEENLKFSIDMKQELRRPETRQRSLEMSQPKPSEHIIGETSATVARTQPMSIVIPAQVSDEKEVYQNTVGSTSNEDLNSETGAIIRTSDLLALTRAVQLYVPGSPAMSFRSSIGSVADDEAMRSMARRSNKTTDPRNSMSQLEGSSPLSNKSRPSASSLDASSHPSGINKLAPDQNGKEIPPDARWTKIKRSLVSPEVLQQDGRRYEARPEFVAVLGVLSRFEIEDLAARSHALRTSRQWRNMPVRSEKDVPPPQPPRPMATQPSFSFDTSSQAHDKRPHSPFSSRSSTSTTESDSESDREHHRGHNRPGMKEDDRRRTTGSLAIPIRGYPNAYGVPVPPPTPSPRSGSSTAQQAMYMSGGLGAGDHRSSSWNNNYKPHSPNSSRNNSLHTNSPSNTRPNQQYPVRDERHDNERHENEHYDHDRNDRNRNRNRSRDRETDNHRNYTRKHSNNDRHRDRDHRDHSRHSGDGREIPRQAKQSRWKEHLASAGIGGAAATLLNVLTEAAEGL